MSVNERAQQIISLQEIRLATDNFSDAKKIGGGGFGKVYSGKLSISGDEIVAMKRLDPASNQGESEFFTEIQMLSNCRHENLIRLIGFCDESGEKMLVYEHAKYGSLDNCLGSSKLSWMLRLQISIGAARGLCYLHNNVGTQHRVLHGDIKSSNILLNENYEARVSDFGLSKLCLSNDEYTYVAAPACGTMCYVDPQYLMTNKLTKESDVYSFGVVLLEILCGKLIYKLHPYETLHPKKYFELYPLAKMHFEQNRLVDIILPNLITKREEEESLDMFAEVAYECLNEYRSKRPKMAQVVEKLEKAWELQVGSKVPKFIRVGPWGRQNDPKDYWSFKIEQDHRLSKIKIDQDDVIYSLEFTSKSSAGLMQTSNKFGGWNRRDTGYEEIEFNDDEKIISINGTIDSRGAYTVVSSLSFVTDKNTRRSFGRPSGSSFSIPWGDGSLVGFYGFAGHHIDGIGVYLKADTEFVRVGTWGSTKQASQETQWSFQRQKNLYLKRIDITHDKQIISLQMIFDTKHGGSLGDSKLAGGWNGVKQINLDWEEEIQGIKGTYDFAKGDEANLTVITSLSFQTNKRPKMETYGDERGTPFEVKWDVGSFAGLYGLGGYFIDSIGVYLKATTSKTL